MKKQEKLALVESALEDFYGDQQFASSLRESVLYSIHAGGKRIRPFLLLEVLEALQVTIKPAHAQVATALEMIHTGSLIHDDLPAMDDDDYRRGRLTNHKKFGEAMAILAGDALFLDSYALIAQADLPSQIKVDLIANLSLASGSLGMVAGQVLDMEGVLLTNQLQQLLLMVWTRLTKKKKSWYLTLVVVHSTSLSLNWVTVSSTYCQLQGTTNLVVTTLTKKSLTTW
ncbi:farnesyl diphosphate synthase [Streptococcus pneumoniae]|nr:farnesyl diphosphate synthase [Streptococcus pneumoniae]